MISNTSALPAMDRIRDCRVLVVGDAMLDRYWHGDVTRISPEAPVPVVHIQREEVRLGGAANVALNIKTLGAQATLLGVVGEDEEAHLLNRMVQKNGVRNELCECPSMKTIVKLRVIGSHQQMLRIDFEEKPDQQTLSSLFTRYESLLSFHDVVLFSDYGKGALAHISQMIQLARQAGKPVLIDPKGSDWMRYAGATAVVPNRSELMQVAGAWCDEQDLNHRAQALCEKLGLQALVLTRSEEGMSLFQRNHPVFHVPTQAREVADVTGAGDTVIATLALLMGCATDWPQAITFANKAGGLAVEKFGTATLTYEELAS